MISIDSETTPEARPTLVYVIPELAPDSIQHFAHSRRLVAELGNSVDLVVVVERGPAPASLPGARHVLVVGSGSRFGRPWRVLRSVLRVRQLGGSTYFLRYSRTFTLVLLLTRPLLRHRILYWRSGMADLRDAEKDDSAVSRIRGGVDEMLNRRMLSLVDTVVTGPETMVGWTAARWGLDPSSIALLYNDVDTDRFRPFDPDERAAVRQCLGWAPKTVVVLFVHHLSFRRGTRLLSEVLRRLDIQHGPDVHLIVVGDGPDRTLLEREAQESEGARVRLSVVGPVPNIGLPPWFAAADVFLMPSYEEGFPRVVLEAMACGTPVVTTDAGGTADLVGHDYPYLREVGDAAGLAEDIAELARLDATSRRRIGMAGRARVVERYSTPVVARMFRELLT